MVCRSMKKICLAVQRYGLEVNGGAELQCRQMAEKLVPYFDVTVVTTKAIDYVTWKNEYTEDEEVLNGVKVIRFSSDKERNVDTFGKINQAFVEGRFTTDEEEMNWIDEQGPVCSQLIQYLKDHKDDYDAFLFFTYLYYPTVIGLSEVKEKAILIPEAHDEPFLRMKPYKKLFTSPKAFFFNTEVERQLVHQKFHNESIKSDIGGAGVEILSEVNADAFKDKYNLHDDYMVYVGRIDSGKNCDVLFNYFEKYKERNHNELKLVLMGKSVIPVPERDDILNLGFVSDEDKFNGIAGAKFLVLPSQFESLSIVVLEAFSLDVPVLVNEDCEVIKNHCLLSNGGLYYHGYFEFEGCVNYLLEHPDICKKMGINGKKYVDENYRWNIIIDKLAKLIDYVSEG